MSEQLENEEIAKVEEAAAGTTAPTETKQELVKRGFDESKFQDLN